MPTSRNPTKVLILTLLALLVCFLTLCTFIPSYEIYKADSSYYLELARSLREWRYNFNFKAHTVYPPGYPLLLAFLPDYRNSLFFPAVIFNTFLATAALALAIRLSKSLAGTLCSILVALSFLTSPKFIELATTTPSSDILFLVLLMLFHLAAVRVLKETSPFSLANRINLCAISVACVAVRSVGIVVIPVLAIFSIRRVNSSHYSRKSFALSCVLAVAVSLVWFVYCGLFRQPDWPGEHMISYFDQFWSKNPHILDLGPASLVDIVVRISNQLIVQMSHLAEMATPLRWVEADWNSFIPLLLGWLTGSALVLSFTSSLESKVAGILTANYLALITLWPFDEGTRFLIPIYPVLLALIFRLPDSPDFQTFVRSRMFSLVVLPASVCALLLMLSEFGIQATGYQKLASVGAWSLVALTTSARLLFPYHVTKFAENIAPSCRNFLTTLFLFAVYLSLLVVSAAPPIFTLYRENGDSARASKQQFANLVEASNWIKSNTLPSDILMAEQVGVLHYLTKRKVIRFPATADTNRIISAIARSHVKYLIVIKPPVQPYWLPDEFERLRKLKEAPQACFRRDVNETEWIALEIC